MAKTSVFENPEKSPYSIEYCDSSWEEQYMKELESDDAKYEYGGRMWDNEDGRDTVKWTKNHGLRIKYFDSENKFKTYVPDFLVEKADGSIELVEMKGTHLLKNPDTKKKRDFAKKWCEARKIKYRTISKYQ